MICCWLSDAHLPQYNRTRCNPHQYIVQNKPQLLNTSNCLSSLIIYFIQKLQVRVSAGGGWVARAVGAQMVTLPSWVWADPSIQSKNTSAKKNGQTWMGCLVCDSSQLFARCCPPTLFKFSSRLVVLSLCSERLYWNWKVFSINNIRSHPSKPPHALLAAGVVVLRNNNMHLWRYGCLEAL